MSYLQNLTLLNHQVSARWRRPFRIAFSACVLLVLLALPAMGQVYVFDNTLNGVKNSGGLGIANAAATGSVVLITENTAGSSNAIANTSSASGRTLTVASGTVSGDTGAYSDTVRVITGGSRQVNNQAGAFTFNFQNLHFKDAHATNAHGVFAWFSSGSGAINFAFDNVTFENFSNETAGNVGAVIANYTTGRTMTITTGQGGYKMLNNHAVGGGAIYNQAQMVLNGTTSTPANVLFSGSTSGDYSADISAREYAGYDVLALHLDINGNANYTFEGGVAVTQRLRFQQNANVTFAPGSFFYVGSGNVLQLNANAKVTFDQIGGYTSSKDLNINDNSTLIVNHSITDDSDTLNLRSVVARADSTIIKTGTANLAMTTTANAISGLVDLQGGGITISGVGANAPTLKAAAGTTFTSSSTGGLELTAASEVNGADINLTAATMKINNNIAARNFIKASDAKLNTNGHTMTVSGRLETGSNFFEMSNGGTLSVSGADVGSTAEATTLTLRGGTMKTDFAVTAPLIITGDALPVTDGLYLQLDASNTDGFVSTGYTGIAAWNKTAGSAANFSSNYNSIKNTSAALLRLNETSAAAPNAFPSLVIDGDLGMQVLDMSSGGHYFRFTNTNAKAVFLVLKDTDGSRASILSNDGNSPFARGTQLSGGTYDGTYALFASDTAAATDASATVQLNGETVDPTMVGLLADEWSMVSFSSANAHTIGSFTRNGTVANNQVWNGSVAEILIFNQELDATQMAYVNAYLNEKWNLGNNISNSFSTTPIYNLDVAESGTLDARGLSTVGFNKVAIQPNQMLNIQQDAGAVWHSDFDVQGALAFNGKLEMTGDYGQAGTLMIDIDGSSEFSSVTVGGTATLYDGAIFDIDTTGFEITDGMEFDILLAGSFAAGTDLDKFEFISDVTDLEWMPELLNGDTLRITANLAGGGGGDDSAVPEPSTWVMLCLGLCALIWRRKTAA